MPAPTQRYYSNVSKIMALQVPLNAVTTSVVVDDASGLPSLYPFNIVLDYGGAAVEVVSCTNVAANVLTVVRGQEDTAATSHSTGAVVVHAATALDFTESAEHIQDTSDVHGTGPAADVVGTVTTQTLTNKTMSGALNTFSAIPASAVTGTFNNITVGQSNASAPALTITPNVAPGVNIIDATYWKMDVNGITRFIAKSAAADVVRVYDPAGTTLRASINETGLATVIGLTTTGAVSGSGQAFTTGTITASGLITANAVVTVPSGQTLTMASGSTVTDAATGTYSGTNTFSGTVNLNATVSFGAASTVTFNNGLTVPSGETATIASGGTVNSASGSTALLNGTITRDSVDAKPLMYFSNVLVPTSTNFSTSGSFSDVPSVTDTFTVPSGRTATVEVTWHASALCNTAGNTQEWLPVIDGTAWQSATAGTGITWAAAANLTITFSFITTLAAGSHTIKIQEKRSAGAAAIAYKNPWSAMTIKAFW